MESQHTSQPSKIPAQPSARSVAPLETTTVDRRGFLGRTMLWGAAAVAGTSALSGCVRAAEDEEVVKFDVACLGDTFFPLWAPGAPISGDMRGSTFQVEGNIYPDGTIPGGSTPFDPASADAIGTWFCRGWFLIHGGRANPHVVTTQDYVFGRITPSTLFPANTMTSSGLEGSDDEAQTPVRPLVGGSGVYAGVRGSVLQHGHGTNTTTLNQMGIPAPNFRFEFRMKKA